MTSQAVIFDLTDTSDERFDRPIEAMLAALLAFMPLALGAVQPWSELVVVAAAALMSLALAAKLELRRSGAGNGLEEAAADKLAADIVAQGYQTHLAALSDPSALADISARTGADSDLGEEAMRVYQERFGGDIRFAR